METNLVSELYDSISVENVPENAATDQVARRTRSGRKLVSEYLLVRSPTKKTSNTLNETKEVMQVSNTDLEENRAPGQSADDSAMSLQVEHPSTPVSSIRSSKRNKLVSTFYNTPTLDNTSEERQAQSEELNCQQQVVDSVVFTEAEEETPDFSTHSMPKPAGVPENTETDRVAQKTQSGGKLVSEMHDSVLICSTATDTSAIELSPAKATSAADDSEMSSQDEHPSTPVSSIRSSKRNKLVSTFYNTPTLDNTSVEQQAQPEELKHQQQIVDSVVFTETKEETPDLSTRDMPKPAGVPENAETNQGPRRTRSGRKLVSEPENAENDQVARRTRSGGKLVSEMYDSVLISSSATETSAFPHSPVKTTSNTFNETKKMMECSNTDLAENRTPGQSADDSAMSSQAEDPSTPVSSIRSSKSNKLVSTFYNTPTLDNTSEERQAQPEELKHQQQSVDSVVFTEIEEETPSHHMPKPVDVPENAETNHVARRTRSGQKLISEPENGETDHVGRRTRSGGKLVSEMYDSVHISSSVADTSAIQLSPVKTTSETLNETKKMMECSNTDLAENRTPGQSDSAAMSSQIEQPSTPVALKGSLQNKLVSTFYNSPVVDDAEVGKEEPKDEQQVLEGSGDSIVFTETEDESTISSLGENLQKSTGEAENDAIDNSTCRTPSGRKSVQVTASALDESGLQRSAVETTPTMLNETKNMMDKFKADLIENLTPIRCRNADSPSRVDPEQSPSLVSPSSPEGEGLDVSTTLESAIRETTIHPSAVRDAVFSFAALDNTEVDVVGGSDTEDENASLLQGVSGTTFISPDGDGGNNESGLSEYLNPNNSIADYDAVKKFMDEQSREKEAGDVDEDEGSVVTTSTNESHDYSMFINPNETAVNLESVKQFKREAELKKTAVIEEEEDTEVCGGDADEEDTFQEYINPSQTILDYSSVKKHVSEMRKKAEEEESEESDGESGCSDFLNPNQTIIDYESVKKFKQDEKCKEDAVVEEDGEETETCEEPSDGEDTFQEYINPSQTVLDYSSVKQFKREALLKEKEALACEEPSDEEDTLQQYINPSETVVDYSSVKKHAAAQTCEDEEVSAINSLTGTTVTASEGEDGSLQNFSLYTHLPGTPTLSQTLTSPAISKDETKDSTNIDCRQRFSLPESTYHEGFNNAGTQTDMDPENILNESKGGNESTVYHLPEILTAIAPMAQTEEQHLKDKSVAVLAEENVAEAVEVKEKEDMEDEGKEKLDVEDAKIPEEEKKTEEDSTAEDEQEVAKEEEKKVQEGKKTEEDPKPQGEQDQEQKEPEVVKMDENKVQEEKKREEDTKTKEVQEQKEQEVVNKEEDKDMEEKTKELDEGIKQHPNEKAEEKYEVRDACTSPLPEVVNKEEDNDLEEKTKEIDEGIKEHLKEKAEENYEVRDACTSPLPQADVDFKIHGDSLAIQKNDHQTDKDRKESVEPLSPVKIANEVKAAAITPSNQTAISQLESTTTKKRAKRKRARITMPKNWQPPKARPSSGNDESKRDMSLYTTNVTLRSMSHMPGPSTRRSSVTFAEHPLTRVFKTAAKVESPCYNCSPNASVESSANASPASLQSILCEGCCSKFKKTGSTSAHSDASRSSMSPAQAKRKKKKQKGSKYVIPCAKGSDDAQIEINVKKKRAPQKRKQTKQKDDEQTEEKDIGRQGCAEGAVDKANSNDRAGEAIALKGHIRDKESGGGPSCKEDEKRGRRSKNSSKGSSETRKQDKNVSTKEAQQKEDASPKSKVTRLRSKKPSDEETDNDVPAKPVIHREEKETNKKIESSQGKNRESRDLEQEAKGEINKTNLKEDKERDLSKTANFDEKGKKQRNSSIDNSENNSSRKTDSKRRARKSKETSEEQADQVTVDADGKDVIRKSGLKGKRRKSKETSDEETNEAANRPEEKNTSKKISPKGKRQKSQGTDAEDVEKTVMEKVQAVTDEEKQEKAEDGELKEKEGDGAIASGKRKSASPAILSCDGVALKKLRSSSTSQRKTSRAKRVSLTKRSQARLLAGRRTLTPSPRGFGVMEGGTPLSTRGNTSRRGGNSSKNQNLSKEAISEMKESDDQPQEEEQPSINITTNTNQKQRTPSPETNKTAQLPSTSENATEKEVESSRKSTSPNHDTKVANTSKSKRQSSRSGHSSPDSSATSSKKLKRTNSSSSTAGDDAVDKSTRNTKPRSLKKTRSKGKVSEISHNSDAEVTVIENETFKQTKGRKSQEKHSDTENVPPKTDVTDIAKPPAITPVRKKVNREYQRRIDTSSLMEEVGAEDDGGIPKPFSKNVSLKDESTLRPATRSSNRSSQQKSIMLMKPPELPVLKKPRESSMVNSSNNMISTSMQSNNSAMSSTLKRRKKMLLNPKDNHARTPKLVNGPLNSTVMENRRMSINTLNTHITNNTSAIALPNVPDISLIPGTSQPRMSERNRMSTSTSRGSYDTFAMPPTLTEYLKTFVPKSMTRGRRGRK